MSFAEVVQQVNAPSHVPRVVAADQAQGIAELGIHCLLAVEFLLEFLGIYRETNDLRNIDVNVSHET